MLNSSSHNCTSDQLVTVVSSRFCGLLENSIGSPFKECLDLPSMDAEGLLKDCIVNTCDSIQDEVEAHNVACGVLSSAAEKCLQDGVQVDWREAAGCRELLFVIPICICLCMLKQLKMDFVMYLKIVK